MYYYFFR